jgi:hypothetical protein
MAVGAGRIRKSVGWVARSDKLVLVSDPILRLAARANYSAVHPLSLAGLCRRTQARTGIWEEIGIEAKSSRASPNAESLI